MHEKMLSVIVPVYNEKGTINEILRRIEAVDIPKEIIIVDDFSTDGTREILRKIRKRNIKIVYHEKNSGKGAAIITGIKHVSGDMVIIQDADLEYDPQDYKQLVKPIIENKTAVVYGTRFARIGLKDLFNRKIIRNPVYYIGNRFLTFMTNLIYFRWITDMETCYKVFRTEVIRNLNLKSKRFDIEPEISAKILKKGYKIVEVPISFHPRSFEEGKKITWRDGIVALGVLLKYRFSD